MNIEANKSSDAGDKKITVNCVAPGGIKTDMYHAVCKEYIPGGEKMTNDEVDVYAATWSPHNRVGQPVDIARVVCFLASQDGEWVNGKVIGIDGGKFSIPSSRRALTKTHFRRVYVDPITCELRVIPFSLLFSINISSIKTVCLCLAPSGLVDQQHTRGWEWNGVMRIGRYDAELRACRLMRRTCFEYHIMCIVIDFGSLLNHFANAFIDPNELCKEYFMFCIEKLDASEITVQSAN
jgi:hypothetical protein